MQSNQTTWRVTFANAVGKLSESIQNKTQEVLAKISDLETSEEVAKTVVKTFYFDAISFTLDGVSQRSALELVHKAVYERLNEEHRGSLASELLPESQHQVQLGLKQELIELRDQITCMQAEIRGRIVPSSDDFEDNERTFGYLTEAETQSASHNIGRIRKKRDAKRLSKQK